MDSKMKKISVLIVALSLVTVIIAITSMAAKEGTVKILWLQETILQ